MMPNTSGARVTVAELVEQLSKFDPDLQVWVLDPAAEDGFSPATGVFPGDDPDPAPGDPQEFVVIAVE